MLKSIYTCDGCGRPTGNVPHITMQTYGGSVTGIAVPPDYILKDKTHAPSNWHTLNNGYDFRGGVLIHFHNGDCAKKYFDRALNAVISPKPPKKA